MCDDIEATVAELRARAWISTVRACRDQGWGILATILVPGGGNLGLYEPRHATAYEA